MNHHRGQLFVDTDKLKAAVIKIAWYRQAQRQAGRAREHALNPVKASGGIEEEARRVARDFLFFSSPSFSTLS